MTAATQPSATSELQELLSSSSTRVEATIDAALSNSTANTLIAAMRYAALGPGKRLRPALVYAVASTFAGPEILDNCDSAAAALECIHAYSLIHDDLPAMDNDDLRRGRATCHIQFDEASAILAGDALQTQAFELLLNAPHSDQLKLQLLSELANASGVRGMVAGQAMDLAAVGKVLDLAQLQQMHQLKTGALISAAARMGALISDANSHQRMAINEYAKAIGLAFQVQDDILDVTTDTDTLGKAQGADAARKKPTYISLLGFDGAHSKAQKLHDGASAALSRLGGDTRLLQALADYIIRRNY
ncbi:MAG: polyprenyl synthetase family protein [Gammaproteobacteria bacterium]|nr:polyprenyl synthetase family protein [Gammaproteobacteria bacterium]